MKNPALAEFMRARPSLIWYSKDYDALDEASVVEHVLNYGTWEDFQEMIRIMGIERAAEVFHKQMATDRQRGNYYPEVARYFDLYFSRHARAHAT